MICVDRLESLESLESEYVMVPKLFVPARDTKLFDKYQYIFRGGAVICLIYIGVV